MKRLVAFAVAFVALVSVFALPVCAADETAPTALEVVSLPLKNRIVFGSGNPNDDLSGIEVKITYSDDTVKTATIAKAENGYEAEGLEFGVHTLAWDERVGGQRGTIFVKGTEPAVSASFDYFAVPTPLSIVGKIINYIRFMIFNLPPFIPA